MKRGQDGRGEGAQEGGEHEITGYEVGRRAGV